MSAQLESCQRALNEFLEDKRAAFPRLVLWCLGATTHMFFKFVSAVGPLPPCGSLRCVCQLSTACGANFFLSAKHELDAVPPLLLNPKPCLCF